jgi:membrane fusion protein (multidrug efflux system)
MSDPRNDSTPEAAAARGNPKRRRRIALTALAVVVVLAIVVGVWPRLRARAALQAQTAALAVPTVQVTKPEPAPPSTELILPAAIEAAQQTPIYARTNGYLKNWYVDIGARVKSGQLLATIDAPEVDDQLKQARADVMQARANARIAHVTAQRWQQLLQTNSVSHQETDMKVADDQARQAYLASMESNVARLSHLQSYEKVYAPFDGVITARNVDVGALIDAGSAGGRTGELFDIARTDLLRVYVDVPQSYSDATVNGTQASLTLPQFPGRTFAGTVVRNTGAINATTRTLRIEVDIPNAGNTVLPGSYGQVHLTLPTPHPGFSLPANALLYRPQGVQVATVDAKGKVALKTIGPGRDFGARIEVLKGLAANDAVILNPADSIVDGESVRVQSTSTGSGAHP